MTLQYIYDVPEGEVDAVATALDQLFRDAPAVEISFGAVGTFPGFPGVHVDVESTPELLDLYTADQGGAGRARAAHLRLRRDELATAPQPLLPSLDRRGGRAGPRGVPAAAGDFLADRVQINRLEGARLGRDARRAAAERDAGG